MLPEKLAWKSHKPHGISASTFGHALGFLGCVSDFVEYQRHHWNTDLAFTGNAATDHGIATEATARTVYEILTRQAVDDGGFHVFNGDLRLACSPDGIVWNQQSGGQQDPVIKRLLEIKSPYKALYDGTKALYQPFGIPQQYMCQMQGQMAITGASECDFFVYLHHPEAQVECWRVRFSKPFWEWALPKLLLVSDWLQHGPPDSLGRDFKFEPFDFSKIVVEPLIPPVVLSTGMMIRDKKRFGWFMQRAAPIVPGLQSPWIRLIYGAQALPGDVVRVDGQLCTLAAIDMSNGFVTVHRHGGWAQGRAPVEARISQDTVTGALKLDIRQAREIAFIRRCLQPDVLFVGARVKLSGAECGPQLAAQEWKVVSVNTASESNSTPKPQYWTPIGDSRLVELASDSADAEGEQVTVPLYCVAPIFAAGQAGVAHAKRRLLNWVEVQCLMYAAVDGVVVVSSLHQPPDTFHYTHGDGKGETQRCYSTVYVVPTHIANWIIAAAANSLQPCDFEPQPHVESMINAYKSPATTSATIIAIGSVEVKSGWVAYQFMHATWEQFLRKILVRGLRSSPLQAIPFSPTWQISVKRESSFS